MSNSCFKFKLRFRILLSANVNAYAATNATANSTNDAMSAKFLLCFPSLPVNRSNDVNNGRISKSTIIIFITILY